MNKKVIFHHFSDIIDNMLSESFFWDTYFQAPFMLEDTVEGSDTDPSVPENISLHFGASRGCIVDEDYDWVVKFDLDGDYLYDSLCAREVDVFRMAQENNLDKYFTEAIYLGTYTREINFYNREKIEQNLNWYDYDPIEFERDFLEKEDDFGPVLPIVISIPLYAYPRANIYQYHNFMDDSDYADQAKAVNSPLRKRNLQIAMEFVYKYGIKEYQRLSDFLSENYVNDIHHGNVMELNGELVLSDYCGFHSSCDTSEDW